MAVSSAVEHRFYTPGVGSSILSPPTSLREFRPDLLFEHDLRANAFYVCREENRRSFSGPCSKTQRRSAGPASRLPGSVFSWCRRAPQGGWEVRRICEARAAGRVVDQNAFDDRSL